MKICQTFQRIFARARQLFLTWCEACRIVVYAVRPVNVLAPVPKSGYKDKNVYVIKYSFNGETRYYLQDEVYPWTDDADDATQYYSMLDASRDMQDFIDEWHVPVDRLSVVSIHQERTRNAAREDRPKAPVRISCDGRWVEVTQEAFIELMEQSGQCQAFDKINERFDFIEE